MENSFQTSFIPKKPVTSTFSGKRPKSLFTLISVFLLIISIIVAISLFVYKKYLDKQQQSLSSSLLNTRDSFEKDTIDELELFNRRTDSVKKILGDHVVFSPMFVLLGQLTIPSIQYTRFQQETTPDLGVIVNIEGVAKDYRSIAIQSDILNSTRGSSFKNVLFSNLMKDKNNNISFNLQFSVAPDLISYENNTPSISTDNNANINTDTNTNTNIDRGANIGTDTTTTTNPLPTGLENTTQ